MSAPTQAVLAAIVAGSATPPEPGPDAELLALGRAFDAAFAVYLAFRPHEQAAEKARDAAWAADPAPDGGGHSHRSPAARPLRRARRPLRVGDRAGQPPARSRRPGRGGRVPAAAAGLARMLAGFNVDLWDRDPVHRDLGDSMMLHVADSALGLAGVDRLGRPVPGDGRT